MQNVSVEDLRSESVGRADEEKSFIVNTVEVNSCSQHCLPHHRHEVFL